LVRLHAISRADFPECVIRFIGIPPEIAEKGTFCRCADYTGKEALLRPSMTSTAIPPILHGKNIQDGKGNAK
jgi:hypothetical protein